MTQGLVPVVAVDVAVAGILTVLTLPLESVVVEIRYAVAIALVLLEDVADLLVLEAGDAEKK